jgi:hypothetical protein
MCLPFGTCQLPIGSCLSDFQQFHGLPRPGLRYWTRDHLSICDEDTLRTTDDQKNHDATEPSHGFTFSQDLHVILSKTARVTGQYHVIGKCSIASTTSNQDV